MKTKICSYCEVEKPATLEFFGKRTQSKDGLEYGCRQCRKERWKAEKEGKPWISAKTIRIQKEKEEGFRTCIDCGEKKPFSDFERVDRSTRRVCSSCHARRQREQRVKNKSEDIVYHSIRESLNGARKRAKEKGYPFDITIEDLMPFPTHCEVSGVELVYGKGDKKHGASLDKVVPSKGYVKGNVRIISQMVNFAKTDLTVKQLKKLIDYIEKYS